MKGSDGKMSFLYMPFLYFPQDKSEYLPAVAIMVIVFVLAIGTLYLFTKKSRKEAEKIEEQYKDKF